MPTDKKSKKSSLKPTDAELKYLENVILGTGSEVIEKVQIEDNESDIPKTESVVEQKKPAWVDDDDQITFDDVVREQGREKRCQTGAFGPEDYQKVTEKKFKKIMGAPKWAEKKNDEEKNSLLNRCGNFLKKKPTFLEKDTIEMKKLKDLNNETYTEGPILRVLQFHPTSTVALVAGMSGVASIFQVDGKQNTKLQSIKFDRFPINCGSFLTNGEEFIVGSQYFKYFYSHNLMTGKTVKIDQTSKLVDITKMTNFKVSPDGKIIAVCGNFGKIYFLSANTKEYIACLKMNCNVNALAFNPNGSKLYSHGDDGEVYIWDVNARSCIHKFVDDGCLSGTSVAASLNDQFLACGSSSGVVNIYDTENIYAKNCEPVKRIFNLVTPVTCVKFNPTSEILSISSDYKWNAIKLVHFPSMTVFSNFPQFHSKLHKPVCVDFSPNSGYFGIGDSKGLAHLYRLKYYGNY